MPDTDSNRFADHCRAQGIEPGAVLASRDDAAYAVVLSVHERDIYSPAHVRTRITWNDQPYSITNAELPEWALYHAAR